MVAFLSVSPNPVEFSWPDITLKRTRDVTVKWATGENRAGRVTVSTGGQPVTLPPAAGSLSGEAKFPIELGRSATVEFRSVDGSTTYQTVTVTTKKDAQAQYITDPDRSFIRSLNVLAGIDSVRVSFLTPEPAVASITLRRRDNGSIVAAPMEPFFSQQHMLSVPNLPQETEFDLKVVALRRNADNTVTVGDGAKNPTVSGALITGSRTVYVDFDLLWMRNDSDPRGSGEISLAVGAGGTFPASDFETPLYYHFEALADGGERPLSGTITGHRAPRTVWVMADGQDDDSDIFGGITLRGHDIEYGPPGTDGREDDYVTWAYARAWVDTDTMAEGRSVPLVVATGNFAIAFTVFGSVRVERRNGRVDFPGLRLHRVRPDYRRYRKASPVLGLLAALFPRRKGSLRVSTAPDGAVIVTSTDGHRTGRQELTDLGAFAGPVISLEDSTEQVWVFGTGEDGQVSAFRVPTGFTDASPEHRMLGGSVVALTAAATDRRIELFGVNGAGILSRLSLDLNGTAAEWEAIGDGFVGDLAAVATDLGGPAVFCRRDDGQVVHRLFVAGERRDNDGAWDDLAVAPDGVLAADWVDDGRSILLRSTASDHSEAVLYWPRYPEADAATEWYLVPAP
jgi:hypothetical protein